MTTFAQFAARCKMRHDFGDQIQVRYIHSDGEDYDTWVSGEEVMRRMRSEAAEERLRRLSRLNWEEIRDVGKQLPEQGKRRLSEHLRDRFADNVEDFLGDSVIGSSLAEAARGGGSDVNADPERQQWRARLQDAAFRAYVLELAWINLRGSFPPEEDGTDFDDWV